MRCAWSWKTVAKVRQVFGNAIGLEIFFAKGAFFTKTFFEALIHDGYFFELLFQSSCHAHG
ncbi:MAG: hypothetical protein LBS94_01135, partial [Prevotellaceae bacterium]|nr:hypothetical protein [Prevotellaceae bacterium]